MPQALKIRRDDPAIRQWMRFEELRRLGIQYISEFSGEVWTDHNLHDPGITILEALCYALTDLGYRTQIDIAELLAPAAPLQQDDNFYTPAEILTCNPLTINDYRKMLVDITGVRNAWLEPAREQEAALYLNCKDGAIDYSPAGGPPQCEGRSVELPPSAQEIKLNGLYNVYLDLDPVLTGGSAGDACHSGGDATGAILQEVKRRLQSHRNLCEDFMNLVVLEDEQVGVCADIELTPTANPDDVLIKMYEAIELFLSPRIRFYSLPEMLLSGKSMEEIFAGRPYTLDSHGFVDTAELEAAELPQVLRASDFYRVIMNIEGVRAIKGLYLASFSEGEPRTTEQAWSLQLMAHHRPVFSPEISRFKFHKGALRLGADASLATERFKKRLLDFQKNKLPNELLDRAIPYGQHRKDLPDYLSIQHEFPLTYRIGAGQMPESATEVRKVQALQLKGYLAFYDQLLADYLSQLGHFRQLLSWNDQQQTYFPRPVHTIPEKERLFRAYDAGAGSAGEILAEATQYYPHPTARDMVIQQLVAAFENHGEDFIQIAYDAPSGGYRFYVRMAPGGDPVLVSRKTYESEADARLDAQSVAFTGTSTESYEKLNRAAAHRYSFQFVYTPVSYQNFLERIAERAPMDFERRNAFLNHLLGRFGEQFTEYVLLMYALNQGKSDEGKIIRDKGRFLQNYGDIGRNRGSGFDYGDANEIWGSDRNISGLERRVSALMGIENWQRRNLNNFAVSIRQEDHRLRVLDHRGQILLETAATFVTEEEEAALRAQVQGAISGAYYERINCPIENAYSFRLLDKFGKVVAVHPRNYGSPEFRDEMLLCLQMYFDEPAGLRLSVAKVGESWGFRLEMTVPLATNLESGEYFLSEAAYETPNEAEEAGKMLLQAIRLRKAKLLKQPSGNKTGFGIRLEVQEAGHPYAAQWHELYPGRELRNRRFALVERYLKSVLRQPAGLRAGIVPAPGGYYFLLPGPDGEVYFKSSRPYATKAEACLAWVVFARLLRSGVAFTDISGNYPGGPHSFAVYHEGERLAQHPRGATTLAVRDAKKKEIAEYIVQKNLRHEIVQQPSAYRWHIHGSDSLLKSAHAFKTQEEAAAAFRNVRELGLEPSNYHPERDDDGGERWVLLRKDGLIMARSPVWENAEDRKARLEEMVEVIRKLLHEDLALRDEPEASVPFGVEIEREEGRFYFVIHDEAGHPALIGARQHTTAEQAECAYYRFTDRAIDSDNYKLHQDEGTCLYNFAVHHPQTGDVLAYHPHYYLEKKALRVQEKLIRHIQERRLPMQLKNLPESWHYRIYWEACDGHCSTLLAGTQEHESEVEAKEDMERLISQLYEEYLEYLNCREEHPNDYEDHCVLFPGLIPTTGANGDSFHYNPDSSDPEAFWAFHPNEYISAARRDRVLADAKKYFEYYFDLLSENRPLYAAAEAWFVCGDSPGPCGDASNATPPRLLSAYRLAKSDQSLARHPRRFYNKAERDAALEDLLERVVCGELQYASLCLKGDRLIKETLHEGQKKYRYALHDNHSGNKLLWLSYETYNSRAEAEAAFHSNWLHILELSLQSSHYEQAEAPVPRLLLRAVGAETPIAFYPLPATGSDAALQARQERQAFARLYPLRRRGDAFYFRVYDTTTNRDAWQGSSNYATAGEALEAFRHFWELLHRRPNYYMANDWNACIFQLQIAEALLEGVRTYSDRFSVQRYATYQGTFETEDKALDVLSHLPASINLQNPENAGPYELRPNGRYAFQLKDTDGNIALRSDKEYNTRREAELDFRQVTSFLPHISNYKIIRKSDGNFEIALQVVALAGDPVGPVEPAFAACPALAATSEIRVGDAPVHIAEHCDLIDPARDDISPICPRAWGVGLQDFLIHAVEDYAYYPFMDVQAGCRYSFRVVTDKYRVALHPARYHTTQDRAVMWDWLFGYSRCHCCNEATSLVLDASTRAGLFHYQIKDEAGQILWRSFRGFNSKEQATDAYEEEKWFLLGYAREPDFYELQKVGTDPADRPVYQLQLINERGQVLAVAPDTYCDGWNEAILQRIQHARRYPFYREGGEYGFRCYSMENSPLYEAPPASDCPPHRQLIEVDVPGELIWESAREYASLADAKCVYDVFCCLLKDKQNIQPIQDGACGLFGLELTHPHEVLAEHPQRYLTRRQADNAMARAQDCINTEGFHLVEHILLRPKQGAGSHITLQFRLPDADDLCTPLEDVPVPMRPYLLLNTVYTDAEAASARKALVVQEIQRAMEAALAAAAEETELRSVRKQVLEDKFRFIPGMVLTNAGLLIARLLDLAEAEEVPVWEAVLQDMIFCFDKTEGGHIARTITACPACCDAVPIPDDAGTEDCEARAKGQLPENAPGAEWYIPDSDPYSFRISIVLPYWPKRFQNANFRIFFEDTLRREAPAHIGLRICWLDPKQMLEFDRRYRTWLEAFSGAENCNLLRAQDNMIDSMFNLTTVYPPARLQGGGCLPGSNSPGGILLGFSQLG